MGSNVYLQPSDPYGYMRGWEGWQHPERKFVLDQIKNGESLLDVGCGSGITFESIKNYGREDIVYKGIDYSAKFIQACKKMYPQARWGKQSANALREGDYSWDVVYIRNTLECMRTYRKPIREALRVARRLVILTFWNLIPDMDFDRIKKEGTRTWGNQYGQKKLERYLDKVCPVWEYYRIPHKNEDGRDMSRFVYLIKKGEMSARNRRGGGQDAG